MPHTPPAFICILTVFRVLKIVFFWSNGECWEFWRTLQLHSRESPTARMAAATHVFVLRHGNDIDRCIGNDGSANPITVVVLLDEVHVPDEWHVLRAVGW